MQLYLNFNYKICINDIKMYKRICCVGKIIQVNIFFQIYIVTWSNVPEMIRQGQDVCDQNELIPVTLRGVRKETACAKMCRFSHGLFSTTWLKCIRTGKNKLLSLQRNMTSVQEEKYGWHIKSNYYEKQYWSNCSFHIIQPTSSFIIRYAFFKSAAFQNDEVFSLFIFATVSE